MSTTDLLLNEFRNKGFNLKKEWVNQCIQHTNSSSHTVIFQQLLCCDMMDWSKPIIPDNFQTFNKKEWNGLYVLQIEDIINLCSAKFEDKHIDPSQNPKLLRLKLSDGYSFIHAMVYQKINNLNLTTPKGTKIAIKNVFVRRSYLMLTNETAKILDGYAANLNQQKENDEKSNNNNNNNNSNGNNGNRNNDNNNNNNNRQRMDIDDNHNNNDMNRNRNNNNNNNSNVNVVRNNNNWMNNMRNNRNSNNRNNNNNGNKNRRNINIQYDDNSFLIQDVDQYDNNDNNNNDNNNNRNNNGNPRKLTQEEILCGKGQPSSFITPNIVKKEQQRLNKRSNVMIGEWSCEQCTFLHKNRPSGICEICGHNHLKSKQENNKENNQNAMNLNMKHEQDDDDEDDDIEIIRNDNNNNNHNKNIKKKEERNEWDNIDIDMNDDDLFAEFDFGSNLNQNNKDSTTTKNNNNKKRRKKKKFV